MRVRDARGYVSPHAFLRLLIRVSLYISDRHGLYETLQFEAFRVGGNTDGYECDDYSDGRCVIRGTTRKRPPSFRTRVGTAQAQQDPSLTAGRRPLLVESYLTRI